ncbi:MAG: MipA/OmpV family protein [Spirochaetes bacterium]|nr:MipA/OmpV family protein [Spirochaetota bacterium]
MHFKTIVFFKNIISRKIPACKQRKIILFLIMAFIVCANAELYAQAPSPLAHWQYSAGEVMAKLGGPLPDWRIMLGITGSAAPSYEGSDKYKIMPGGFPDIRFRDIAFISAGEGIGVNLLRGLTWRAGISAGYNPGRKNNNDDGIKGLDKISPSPEIAAFAQVFIMPIAITADIRRAIGGHNGWIGDLGFYLPLSGSTELVLFAGPSITIADSAYMDAYFGIDQKQSVKSKLPEYKADACVKNVNFGITALYYFTEHIFIISEAAYERLLLDAAESPVSAKDDQFTADLSIAYSF